MTTHRMPVGPIADIFRTGISRRLGACIVVLAALLLPSSLLHAGAAGEVFEAAAKSTVVVHAYDSYGEVEGIGSGVAFTEEAVATNCHVIEQAAQLAVRYEGQEYSASALHTDRDRDVCTLTVSGLKIPPVKLGSTESLSVGARVYAVGAPQGLELTLSEGIVSSLREIAGGQYIQTTTPISPGSSGGGLFDKEGRLLGITTFYLADGQNLNFALPVEWIVELPDRHEEVEEDHAISETEEDGHFFDWHSRLLELRERGDWNKVLSHALRWTEAMPEESLAWVNLGVSYDKLGQLGKAIDAFREALNIDPENGYILYNIGRVYWLSGESNTKAISHLQEAVTVNPNLTEAWQALGFLYRGLGQTNKAIEVLTEAVRANPERARAWLDLGDTLRTSGQTAKAVNAYEQAISIYEDTMRSNVNNAEVWRDLASAYEGSGETDKAIEAYQEALRLDPTDLIAWNNLGVAYNNAGNTRKVREVYQRLREIDTKIADHFFNNVVLP